MNHAMKNIIPTFLTLALTLTGHSPALAEDRRPRQDLNDADLARIIRQQGEINAIQEVGFRRKPEYKKLLEDIAETYQTNWRKYPKGSATGAVSKANERD